MNRKRFFSRIHTTYGPYHMDHIIWTISYGPYVMIDSLVTSSAVSFTQVKKQTNENSAFKVAAATCVQFNIVLMVKHS